MAGQDREVNPKFGHAFKKIPVVDRPLENVAVLDKDAVKEIRVQLDAGVDK